MVLDNIKNNMAGLSLTMAVGCAAASDELTMVVGTYTDQSTSDGICLSFQPTNGEIAIGQRSAGWQSFVSHDRSVIPNRVYAVSEYDDGREDSGLSLRAKRQ